MDKDMVELLLSGILFTGINRDKWHCLLAHGLNVEELWDNVDALYKDEWNRWTQSHPNFKPEDVRKDMNVLQEKHLINEALLQLKNKPSKYQNYSIVKRMYDVINACMDDDYVIPL